MLQYRHPQAQAYTIIGYINAVQQKLAAILRGKLIGGYMIKLRFE